MEAHKLRLSKDLNNLVEQDHRGIKSGSGPCSDPRASTMLPLPCCIHAKQGGIFFISLQILTKSKLFLTEHMVIVRYASQRKE
jgi:hypothetical protein